MKRQVTSFNEWISENLSLEEQRLKELNEAFDPKDEKRVQDILDKADGDDSKAESLAKTMATLIKDANKAVRRGDAAVSLGAKNLADIFYERAKELGADIDVEEEVEKEEEPKEDKNPEEDKPKKEKKQRAPKPSKIQSGDYVRITGRMVKDQKVGLADKGGWRWIEATGTGKRALLVTDPDRVRRGASGRYNRGYFVKIDPTAKIDLDYINDHLDQGIFYIKVLKAGAQWIEGIPMFFNGLDYYRSTAKIRIQKKEAGPNGPELDIILANPDLINSGRGISKFFLGDEDFAMNKKGEALDDFKPGVYTLAALNFELTVKEGEPIVYCVPSNEHGEDRMGLEDVFFAPISKCKELANSYSPEQFKVIADYMSKQLGAEVKAPEEEKIGPYSRYKIEWFLVSGGGKKGYPGSYSASPFFTVEKAEKHIQEIKDRAEAGEKFAFDVNSLKVVPCSSYQQFELNFQQMMEYANLAGIGIKMRKFIEEKRGAIAAKKFGF